MFRSTLIAGFALALTLQTSAQESRVSVSSIESLIRSQQYDQALDTLKIALRRSPGDYKLWTLEGICFALQGDESGARAAFDRAIQISPDYTPALKGEVQLLYKSGDRRAIPLLERILKVDPADSAAHEMLGILEKRAGDCRAAATQFLVSKEAIANQPDSLEAYGYCLVQLKQTNDAIQVFRQLIPLLPGQVYPSYDLAVLLVAAHNNDEAVKILEPLLTSDQNDPDVLSLASQAYEASGNTPRAVALQRQAIVLDPTDASNYVAFAVLCLNHDSFQVGIDMLNAGLKHIPDNSSLYLSRGVLYVQLGDYDRAETDIKTAEQLDSKLAVGAYAADLATLQKNDPAQALVQVRAHLKAHPESPLLHFLLAQLLMNQAPEPQSPAFKEAMQNALRAAQSKPDLVDAHNLLASMYLSLNQFDRAIKESKTALQYDPSNETALYRLILALRHSGRGDDLQPLVKRLSELHRESLQHETDRKKYRLVEQESATSPQGANH
ncbi:MAG: tetratricopeptide repeat protein [Terracidiphilus sp.]|jgi:tetratricopeptide (TPR) repeat protein